MHRSTTLLLTLGTLAFAACDMNAGETQGGATDAADTAATQNMAGAVEATRADLEQVNREFVERYNQGDLEGFVQVYTDDAKLYPPNMQTLEGREAITEFWRAGQQQMGIRDVSLTTEELEIVGDRAWEVGRANYTTNQGPVEGRYMVVWKRLPTGEWRWHRDFMNSAGQQNAESADTASGAGQP